MNEGTNTTLRDLDRAARLTGGVIRLAQGPQSDQLVAGLGSGVSRKRVANILGGMAAAGGAVRAGTGRYLLPLDRGVPDAFAAGPFLTRGRAYVSMWNVAERAGLSMNTPRFVSVVVDRTPTDLVLEVPEVETTYYFHQIKPEGFFGFAEESTRGGLMVPVATVEKALIDMLWFIDAPDTPPPFEMFAIWQEAAASSAVNPRLLIKHAIRMGSPALIRRVGYLMERFGIRGHDDLFAHRGTGKGRTPLFGVGGQVEIGANRWMVG